MLCSEERIVAVAIRHRGLVVTLPAPNRHHHILHLLYADEGREVEPADKQGFLTSAGRFVERREAAGIAETAGQIVEPKWPPDLYSEDLW